MFTRLLAGEFLRDDGPSVTQLIMQGEQQLLLPVAPLLFLCSTPRTFPYRYLPFPILGFSAFVLLRGWLSAPIFLKNFCIRFETTFWRFFWVFDAKGGCFLVSIGHLGLRGDGGKLILLCKIIAVYIVFNTFYPGIEKHFMDTVSWVADGYQLLHTCFE